MALCDNVRLRRCRLARGERWRGYSASKRRCFYGVRVQVVVTVEGLPVEFCSLPGMSDVSGELGRASRFTSLLCQPLGNEFGHTLKCFGFYPAIVFEFRRVDLKQGFFDLS